MKRLLIKSILFLSVIFLFDQVIGRVVEKMYFSIETGTSGALINHLSKNSYDVYIMGASGAQHGYIPDLIAKEIGLSVYNAGEDGTDILYKYSIFQLFKTKPKLIIWDVTDFDYYFKKELSGNRLMKPYHRNPKIGRLLNEIDKNNLFLYVSKIYPFNQKFVAILSDYVKEQGNHIHTDSGYVPNYGAIDLVKFDGIATILSDYKKIADRRKKTVTKQDRILRSYLHRFIEECQSSNVKLVAFVSPNCPASKELATQPMISSELIMELLKYGIPVNIILPIDYPDLNRVDLFRDLSHLNNDGAIVYSKIVANILQKEKLKNTQ